MTTDGEDGVLREEVPERQTGETESGSDVITIAGLPEFTH